MRKTSKRVKRPSYRKKRSMSKRKYSTSRRYRKHNKTNALAKGTALAKGPTSDNVNCCMCGKEIVKINGLIPGQCLRKNGSVRAHRICEDCWWDPVSGFAKEGVNHSCPGCVKGLPLNGPAHNQSTIFVDLTEDD
jgi:hypothetical protein